MQLVVCLTCNQRPHECICSSSSWKKVDLETPVEVEDRLHRLLDAIAADAPAAEAACRRLKRDVMQASAPPDSGRRAELRSDKRRGVSNSSARRGEKLA